jgi:hypothetical protein
MKAGAQMGQADLAKLWINRLVRAGACQDVVSFNTVEKAQIQHRGRRLCNRAGS